MAYLYVTISLDVLVLDNIIYDLSSQKARDSEIF